MTSTGVIFAIFGCTNLATIAGTITDWNVTNLVTTPSLNIDVDGNGFSYIYDKNVPDGNVTDATTNGYVKVTPTGSIPLRIAVDNNTNPAGKVDRCILAKSDSTCNDPFQSHKRFKLDRTGLVPIDLVFDANNDLAIDNDGILKNVNSL